MKSPSRALSRWRTAAAVLLAALVPVLVFWRGALLRGVYFQGDLVIYYLPAYTYATRVLRTGVVPLWAPEVEGGQPFHAQWEPTLLYPVAVPFRFLLPPWWALNLALIFHYALAAVGMFVYARRLSLSRSAALVSAAIYAVNGFMIAHLEHPNLIVGAAWLPWLLLAVDYGLADRPAPGMLGMGAVLGMMLLGGHPDLFLMGALVVGLMVLLHPVHGILRQRRLRDTLFPLGMLAGGYALGIALAGAQMLPTIDLAHLAWAQRSASPEYTHTWSLTPLQFLVQLFPDLYGRNGQDTYWGLAHYWEECSYMGTLALALAAVGLVSRHRLARYYGGLAVLAAWLAVGTNGVAFSLLQTLPAFGTTRLPCRYMFLFDLSVAVLAGMGAHWLPRIQRPQERARALWVRGVVLRGLGLVTLGVIAWGLPRHRLLDRVTAHLREVRAHLVVEHHASVPDVALLLHRYQEQLGVDGALLVGGLALAAALIGMAVRSRGRQRLIAPAAFAGVVATLFVFGSGYHTVIPARRLAEMPFTVAAIPRPGPGDPYRVLQWDTLKLHSDVAVHRGWWPAGEHGYRQYIAGLPGNYNLMWGLSSVRQEEWSALPLPYTARFAREILAKGDRLGFGAMAPYLRWLNTGYVISEHALSDPSLALIAADRIHLYRTRDPGRRAWIVHDVTFARSEPELQEQLLSDPAGLTDSIALLSGERRRGGDGETGRGGEGGTGRRGEGERRRPGRIPLGRSPGRPLSPSPRLPVSPSPPLPVPLPHRSEGAWIMSRSSTRVTLEAVAERAGYLVLGESWAPGWKAWVDGKPAPVLRANLIHRAVPLAAGRHRIVFRYEPASFRLGLYVSVCALAALLALSLSGVGRKG